MSPYSGNSQEVDRWLRLLGPLSTAPSNYIQDREGPSIYDDVYPSVSPQVRLLPQRQPTGEILLPQLQPTGEILLPQHQPTG